MRRLFVLMAVLYFCLILFAFSTLVQEGNGARNGGGNTPTTGTSGDKSTTTTVSTEGKGGAATSGAPALTSTISAVLLAYVAEILA
ncbi:hypothetical protein ECG_08408 [Echinococcus granulosus]|uniref:Uncharacterized protein n=1 Tax=Echinococcus granulosus TaxID=6210 RepID=A0A068WMM7_ECHGR|nr:hypothetical protein ECG_08408 [Echinococcus granulosus]CDS21031.1 hypothetical protein EgrG_000540500 [Echinococcus granulosus]